MLAISGRTAAVRRTLGLTGVPEDEVLQERPTIPALAFGGDAELLPQLVVEPEGPTLRPASETGVIEDDVTDHVDALEEPTYDDEAEGDED